MEIPFGSRTARKKAERRVLTCPRSSKSRCRKNLGNQEESSPICRGLTQMSSGLSYYRKKRRRPKEKKEKKTRNERRRRKKTLEEKKLQSSPATRNGPLVRPANLRKVQLKRLHSFILFDSKIPFFQVVLSVIQYSISSSALLVDVQNPSTPVFSSTTYASTALLGFLSYSVYDS